MTRTVASLVFVAFAASACSSPGTPAPGAAEDKAAAPAPAAQPQGSTEPASPATTPAAEPATSAAPPSSASALQPAAPARAADAAVPPATAANAAPAPAEPAPAPAVPAVRELTIPGNTLLTVTLESTLASDTSRVEDPVRGTLARPIVVDGRTIVPAGAEISGTVLDAKESGRVKGRASITFAFDHLTVNGERYRVRTARVTRVAESSKTDDLKKGGIGAAAGAIIGGLAGGGKGAAIGAGVGATGAVLATKGREVRLEPGTRVSTRLQGELTVTVPAR